MNIELAEATEADRGLVENLLQLYAYDLSEIVGFDANELGRFDNISIGEPSRDHWVFIIRFEKRLAGFASVQRGSALAGETDVTDMDEFFVMRKYRRQGVGREVAHRLFDRFPGRWEVREMAQNLPAQDFWRRIIGEYTNGKYEERVFDEERWRGPVQFFVSNST